MTIEDQARSVRVVAGSIGLYEVPSASHAGRWYQVNINTEYCPCFGLISARKVLGTCRHIKAVYLWIYWQLSEVQQRAAESVINSGSKEQAA